MPVGPLAAAQLSTNRRQLFLIGFLTLFLELACIRWFAAYVIFLQFFTNFILIASFLGLSIGCVCAGARPDWLRRFPALSLTVMGLAMGFHFLYRRWRGVAIDVGGQRTSPQLVFFGTEFRDMDVARFVVPMELIAALFFVLVTLMFIGLGQRLARGLDQEPSRIAAYIANIAGSLAGILAFAIASFVNAPPIVWFLIGFAGVGYLLHVAGELTRAHVVLLALTALLILLSGLSLSKRYEFAWSPYYWIRYARGPRVINVNNISHQQLVPIDQGPVYSLIHLLQRDAGAPPFEHVLIIGAGGGNDVAHALRNHVKHVDAVEIDPVIQRLGERHHPERPYADPRVHVHLDDGRSFLRTTPRKYDLVIYALVDSLILHSSYSNIRLESFLFTEQAFRDVKNVLKPDGVFVSYNFFRQGWLVQRIADMVERVFGQAPLTISLPHVDEIRADDPRQLTQMTAVVAGTTARFLTAFAKDTAFWLNRTASRNDRVNGFGPHPPASPAGDDDQWLKIAPTMLVGPGAWSVIATDDWPFLYLRSPTVPGLLLRGALLSIALGLAMLFWLAPGHRVALNGQMFFLGAGFLLLETKAVVHLALVFGSTWVVNSLVFAAILVMILGANLYVLRASRIRVARHYAALAVALGLNVIVPLDVFLGENVLWKYVASSALVMSPIFFAGVVFAVAFRASARPGMDFGANVAGAVIGGFAEYLSLVVGFRYLVLVAIAAYALSAALSRGRPTSIFEAPG
jgi:SAM-dependent methyltransferase